MNVVAIREEVWKVLYMRRLLAVCHKCKWTEYRMVNPGNQGDIEEIKKLIRVAHATKMECPVDITII